MNESGVQKLLKNKVNLGADASVAAGPVGRRGGVSTDAVMTAEILSYSRSKGLFAGIDISGGVLRPDEDANKATYGAGATPRTILATREMSAPPEAAAFLSRAEGHRRPATERPIAIGLRARAAPRAGDGCRRPTTTFARRVVDIQQSVDRMLADTTPAAVGTSGTADEVRQRHRHGRSRTPDAAPPAARRAARDAEPAIGNGADGGNGIAQKERSSGDRIFLKESPPLPAPKPLSPMMAVSAATLPDGADWSYEVKWDGYRAQAVKHGPSSRSPRAISRTSHAVS